MIEVGVGEACWHRSRCRARCHDVGHCAVAGPPKEINRHLEFVAATTILGLYEHPLHVWVTWFNHHDRPAIHKAGATLPATVNEALMPEADGRSRTAGPDHGATATSAPR